MNAEADSHLPCGNREKRAVGAGERAAGEGDSEGARGRVRLGENALDLLEVLAGLGGRPRDLEDREVPRNAAALVEFVLGAGGYVVGDHQGVGGDSLRAQTLDGLAEMQDVARVVPESHEHSGAAVCRLENRVRLGARRGGEDVPAHGAVGDPGAYPAGERRVVTRSAAVDHGHLPLRSRGGADDAAVDRLDVALVGQDEPSQRLGGKIRRCIY